MLTWANGTPLWRSSSPAARRRWWFFSSCTCAGAPPDARGAAVGYPLACHPDQSNHHRFLLARLDTDSGGLGIVPVAPSPPARKSAPPAVTWSLQRQKGGA